MDDLDALLASQLTARTAWDETPELAWLSHSQVWSYHPAPVPDPIWSVMSPTHVLAALVVGFTDTRPPATLLAHKLTVGMPPGMCGLALRVESWSAEFDPAAAAARQAAQSAGRPVPEIHDLPQAFEQRMIAAVIRRGGHTEKRFATQRRGHTEARHIQTEEGAELAGAAPQALTDLLAAILSHRQ